MATGSQTDQADAKAEYITKHVSYASRTSTAQQRKPSRPVVIDANYRVGRRIGRGNFGEVRLGKT